MQEDLYECEASLVHIANFMAARLCSETLNKTAILTLGTE